MRISYSEINGETRIDISSFNGILSKYVPICYDTGASSLCLSNKTLDNLISKEKSKLDYLYYKEFRKNIGESKSAHQKKIATLRLKLPYIIIDSTLKICNVPVIVAKEEGDTLDDLFGRDILKFFTERKICLSKSRTLDLGEQFKSLVKTKNNTSSAYSYEILNYDEANKLYLQLITEDTHTKGVTYFGLKSSRDYDELETALEDLGAPVNSVHIISEKIRNIIGNSILELTEQEQGLLIKTNTNKYLIFRNTHELVKLVDTEDISINPYM